MAFVSHFQCSSPGVGFNSRPYSLSHKMFTSKWHKQIQVRCSSSHDDHAQDRERDLKAFDDSKAGVKGLSDLGVPKLPRMFVHEDINHGKKCNNKYQSSIPVIDLEGSEVIDKIGDACQNWGFFQVINHGIPLKTMEEMLNGIRMFHEQDLDLKREYYTLDIEKNVAYYSNYDLYNASAAVWKDTLTCKLSSVPNPEELPMVCRDSMIEYSNHVTKLAVKLLGFISNSLGLETNHLAEMGCAEGLGIRGHYYPACPEPELTLGVIDHTDCSFLTILLQDHIGGLQVLHQNEWVDVPCLPGAIVINLGDLMQMVTNDRFRSVNHRVVAKKIGPRISAATFFRPHSGTIFKSQLYGPIKKLLCEEKPPIYGETTIQYFEKYFFSKNRNADSALTHFKLNNGKTIYTE